MRILIIGKNSYIGNHIDEWLSRHEHEVMQLDVLTDEWKIFDYSPFDAIVHVAGIVHRPGCNDWGLYERVNTNMPVSIATMAKEQGVKQYVFLSTMGVYGLNKELRKNVVDKNTPLISESLYGKSKRLAEKGLFKLQDGTFTVTCLRPPSVYGKGCRGRYISGFTSIAKKLPIIPFAYPDVKQSMLYIDNLAELVRLLIENRSPGVFCPQDDISVSANELLSAISEGLGKKCRTSSFLGRLVQLVSFLPIVTKAYGGVEYDRELSTIDGLDYIVVPFREAMKRTVYNDIP